MAHELAERGGLFAILVFIHFWADWVFQSHTMATQKSTNWRLRLRHCIEYALWFAPLLIWLDVGRWQLAAALLVLFGSHFLEDTYLLVYWWAKYIRRMPPLQFMKSTNPDFSVDPVITNKNNFKALWDTPIGAILFITFDQLIHISFLWVVVWLVLGA